MHSQSQAITALEKQYSDVDNKSRTLQNKLDNSQKLIETKEQDIPRLKANLSEAENSRKQQNTHLDTTLAELEHKVKEEQETCAAVKHELEGGKAAVAEKESKIERVALAENLQHKTTALENKEKELKEVFDSFMELKASGKSEHEATLTEMENLRKEVACLTEKLDQASVANEMKDQDVESMIEFLQTADKEKDKANKEKKLKEVSDSLMELKARGKSKREATLTEMEKLRKKVACLTEKLDQGSVANEMKDQYVESINELLQTADEEKQKLSSQLEELSEKKVVLEEQIADLQRKLEQVSEVVRAKDEELLNQSTIIKNLEKANEEEAGKLKGERDQLENQVFALQEKYMQLETCTVNKDGEISSANEKIQELTMENSKLHDDLASKAELIEGMNKERLALAEKSTA